MVGLSKVNYNVICVPLIHYFQAALEGIRKTVGKEPLNQTVAGSCIVCSVTEETLSLIKREADANFDTVDPLAPFVPVTSDFPGATSRCSVRFKLYKVLNRIIPSGESAKVCPVCLDTVVRIDRLEQQETALKQNLK